MDNNRRIIIRTIRHFRHRHDLHLHRHDSFYTCSVCGRSGFGPRFSCTVSNCVFNLHEECCDNLTPITPITIHPFLIESNFKIFKTPAGLRLPTRPDCNACREKIMEDPYYHCGNLSKNLHLHCARLPTTMTINGMRMTLRNALWAKCSYSACPRKNRGWSYFSPNDQYSYHVACWLQRERNPAVTLMISLNNS